VKYMHSRLAIDICMISQKTTKDVYLKKGFIQVDAKSVLGVMSLVDLENTEVITQDEEIKQKIKKILEG
jgi:phosphotransferase system HPr-like phosphotransfer protein